VLSAGHGSMLIYSLLHLTGYAARRWRTSAISASSTAPAPVTRKTHELPGVECTTGPLGQGLAMAVGMAMAERHLNAGFGDALVDHKTWVIAGDGCLMEGVNHEAIGLAGHLKLGRLNVLWDDNRITIDGDTDAVDLRGHSARFAATGWHVTRCDGHDFADIARALAEAQADPRPSLVACNTVIGKGAPNKQGSHNVHGSPLGGDEVAATREALGWTAAPFEVPADIWPTGARSAQRAPPPAPIGKAALPPPPSVPNSSRMAGDLARRACSGRLHRRSARRESAEGRDPQGLGNGAGSADRKASAAGRRFG
jgi:transketolase